MTASVGKMPDTVFSLPSAHGCPSSFVLCSLVQMSSRGKVANAPSGKRPPSDKVYETIGAPAAFKSNTWKYFAFPVSRKEKEKKMMDRQKIGRYCRTITNTHLMPFLHVL